MVHSTSNYVLKRAGLFLGIFLTLVIMSGRTTAAQDLVEPKWGWMSGSKYANQYGSYGTMGVAAASNMPGTRSNVMSWTGPDGKFWFFGGYGRGASTSGKLNDLWKYDPDTGLWTWMDGGTEANQPGSYDMQSNTVSTNIPGGRYDGVSWIGPNGKFWLFGGNGIDSSGDAGNLNDLWS